MAKIDNTRKTTLIGIGEAAEQLGVTLRTIRFYNEKGLIATSRGPGGARYLDPHNIERVRFILKMKSYGFIISEIKLMFAGVKPQQIPKISVGQMTAQLKHVQTQRDGLDRMIADLKAGLNYPKVAQRSTS